MISEVLRWGAGVGGGEARFDQITVPIRIRKDRPEQTMQTQIRRRRTMSRVYNVCHSSSNFTQIHT